MPFSLPVLPAALRSVSNDDRIKVIIGSLVSASWLEVDVDSDIFTPADAFRLTTTVPSIAEGFKAYQPGVSLDVYMSDDRQMAGVIDDIEISSARTGPRITITGRDKGAWLVDSESPHLKVKSLTLIDMAKQLLRPSFGIRNVLLSNADNRQVVKGKKDIKPLAPAFFFGKPRTIHLDPGHRIASILDEHTRRNGVTWWMTAQGDLFIGKPDYKQAPSYSFHCASAGSKDAAWNNIESYSVKQSVAQRFSKIIVLAQNRGPDGMFATTSTKTTKYKAEAVDPDLVAKGIVREQILVDADIISQDQAQARADYEMGKARMTGVAISITVPDYRQQGALYAIDTMASVRIDDAGINGLFYVGQRRFTADSQGKHRTQLTLYKPALWLP